MHNLPVLVLSGYFSYHSIDLVIFNVGKFWHHICRDRVSLHTKSYFRPRFREDTSLRFFVWKPLCLSTSLLFIDRWLVPQGGSRFPLVLFGDLTRTLWPVRYTLFALLTLALTQLWTLSSTHRHINTSTHQHINTNVINTTHQHISIVCLSLGFCESLSLKVVEKPLNASRWIRELERCHSRDFYQIYNTLQMNVEAVYAVADFRKSTHYESAFIEAT
jgi:hypothetical protein